MTLKLIDQALNVAITSLFYGSETWLALAFALYVVTHKTKKAKAQDEEPQTEVASQLLPPQAISPPQAIASNERTAQTTAPKQVTLVANLEKTELETVDLEKVVEKAVEKIAVQKTATSNTSQTASPKKASDKEISPREASLDNVSLKPSTPQSTVPKRPSSEKTTPQKTAIAKTTAKKVVLPKLPKISSPDLRPQQIVCEPVNWKKWKVSDLRKASIAKVCGVRMTPIGSRRKLSKADLIAQYEQNLKRMTKPPMAQTSATSATSAYPQAAKRVV